MPAVRNSNLSCTNDAGRITKEPRIPIRSDESEWENPLTGYDFPLRDTSQRGRRQNYDSTTPSPRSTSTDTGTVQTQVYSPSTATYSTPTTPSPPIDQVCDDSLMICTCPNRAPIIPKGASGKNRVRVRRVKNQDHIPRPRNAFIIFRSHYINFLKAKVNSDGSPISDAGVLREQTYLAEDEGLFVQDTNTKRPQSSSSAEYPQNELSKIAAKVWNNMDTDERKPYAEEARKEKEWHKEMYPDYVYRAASASGEKTKNFRIKVKMGNPSKGRERSDKTRDSTSLSSGPNARAPQSHGRQEPDYSDDSSVAAPLVHSNIDPRQLNQENPSQHYDQQCLLQSIGAEQEFVPIECIPPLELCSSGPIVEQESQDEADMKPKKCPPQPTYAVDLSPRSLAYDQYQPKDTLSTSYPEAFMAASNGILGYEYGTTEFEALLAGFGPNEGLTTEPSFLDIPTATSFEVNEIPYLSFLTASDSFSPPAFLPLMQNLNFDSDFSPAFQLESINVMDKPMALDLDVPDFNFQLGDGMMDDLSLAAWAGYE